jgi:hypothetical protein
MAISERALRIRAQSDGDRKRVQRWAKEREKLEARFKTAAQNLWPNLPSTTQPPPTKLQRGRRTMTLPPRQITRLEPAMTIFERMRRDLHATQAEADIMGDPEARRAAHQMVVAALKRLGIGERS